MKRGQIPVLWVVIELVLVVIVSTGIFLLVDRARESDLPEQLYSSREIAFTREAVDIYALTAVYYELNIPGISIKGDTSITGGKIEVGGARKRYGYDKFLQEDAYGEPNPLGLRFEVAGGITAAGVGRRDSRKLSLYCPKGNILGTIAIIPTTTATEILTNNLVVRRQDKLIKGTEKLDEELPKIKKDVIDSADAFIILEESATPKQVIAEVNSMGNSLGCRLVNSLAPTLHVALDPQTDVAVSPLSPFFNTNITNLRAQVPDDKPLIILTISPELIKNAEEKLINAIG